MAVSVSAQNRVDVSNLYVAMFGRAPDGEGLGFWTNLLAGGTSVVSVANTMFATAPARTYYPSFATNQEIVNGFYLQVLGRAADAGGLAYWTAKLSATGGTPGSVIAEMISVVTSWTPAGGAANAATDAAGALSKSLFVNKADVALYYGLTNGTVAGALVALNGVTDVASTVTAAKAVIDGGLGATGQVFTLTAGIDAFVGGATNDIINSLVAGGLSDLDNIDGGTGLDILNVTSIGAITVPGTATVKNIETANLVSTAAVSGDVSGWTGLTKLNVTEIGGTGAGAITAAGTTAVVLNDGAQAAGNIAVNGGAAVTLTSTGATGSGTTTVGASGAPAGAISITQSSAATSATHTTGAVTVTGGTTVNIVENYLGTLGQTITGGAITVNGGAATTAVSVAQTKAATASGTVTGVVDGAVTVTDINNASATLAGTITSVTASNYTTLTINDNALTTLNVTGGSGNITVGNGNLTLATNKTLAVTANGLTGGSLIDSGVYTALNITTATAASTLANISQAAVAALTVAGTQALTLTSTAGLAALKTVTVSGAAGLTADFSGLATVTAVDTSATTGASTVTVNAANATFTGGAGVDKVTAATGLLKAIDLGAGDDTLTLGALVPTATLAGGIGTDTLSLDATAAATASGSAAFAVKVSSFEKLALTGATNQTIDLAVLGNYNYVTTSGGNGLTLSNLSSGGTLALTGAGTAYTIGNTAFTAGTSDVINLTLTADASAAGTNFAATGITATNVETLAITTVDTQTTPAGAHDHALTLLGNTAKTITVGGNAGLTLTATDTAATLVDASGITLGGFSFTSGALAAAATIKGSATGTNTVDFSAATGGVVTYVGGTGNDAIISSNGRANIITLGDGANSVNGTTGNHTVTGGAGADTVNLTTGNNTVSLGNGANSFTATTGNNTYVGGTGVDTVTLGGGVNTITTGTGADVITFTGAVIANGNSYSTITDAHAGLKLVFTDNGLTSGTATFTTAKLILADTAVFQDFLDAGTASAGTATNSNISWFQFGGNTYVVEDNSAATTFQNAGDAVVKLTGLVDLSTATFAAVAATSGSLTLV